MGLFRDFRKMIVESQDIDILEQNQIQMYHNSDFVTLKSIIPHLITVIHHPDPAGPTAPETEESTELIWLSPKTFTHFERTPDYPGAWTTRIYWVILPEY